VVIDGAAEQRGAAERSARLRGRSRQGGLAVPADDFSAKLPPQNLSAEQGVLGSVLVLNEAIDEIADMLQPAHFYSEKHQILYAAILRMYESGIRGIDAVTLAEHLDTANQLEAAGGVRYLMEILDAVPHAAHVKYYAEIVRDKWIQRSLTNVCTEVLKECYDGSSDTADILTQAERGIFQILEQKDSGTRLGFDEILIEAMSRITERLKISGSISA
jgi:replicative DNA helicase